MKGVVLLVCLMLAGCNIHIDLSSHTVPNFEFQKVDSFQEPEQLIEAYNTISLPLGQIGPETDSQGQTFGCLIVPDMKAYYKPYDDASKIFLDELAELASANAALIKAVTQNIGFLEAMSLRLGGGPSGVDIAKDLWSNSVRMQPDSLVLSDSRHATASGFLRGHTDPIEYQLQNTDSGWKIEFHFHPTFGIAIAANLSNCMNRAANQVESGELASIDSIFVFIDGCLAEDDSDTSNITDVQMIEVCHGMADSEVGDMLGPPDIVSEDQLDRSVWTYDRRDSPLITSNEECSFISCSQQLDQDIESKYVIIIKFDENRQVREFRYDKINF